MTNMIDVTVRALRREWGMEPEANAKRYLSGSLAGNANVLMFSPASPAGRVTVLRDGFLDSDGTAHWFDVPEVFAIVASDTAEYLRSTWLAL